MQTFNTTSLLDELEERSKSFLMYVDHLTQQPNASILEQSEPGKWNAVQVLEHLNSYYRFYLPAIEKEMNSKISFPATSFKPGWLGDYFSNLMEPTNTGKLKSKMKSPKNHRPADELHAGTVIDEFKTNQQKFISLLRKAAHSNISDIRVPISLSKLIRLKLGDVFRFIVAHNQRHQLQIANTIYPSLSVKARLAF